MKRITFLLLLCISCASINYAQCINTEPYPTETIVSNNSGDPQLISTCIYTGNFSTISNILPGLDYTFSLESENENVVKYITITDNNNNLLAQGATPLVVNDLPASSIRLHYSETAGCGTVQWCLSAFLKVTLTCPFPTNIQISGLTSSNANFTWTPGGDEQAWQVMVQEKGTASPTEDTSGTDIENTPEYSVASLETGKRYEFFIRANCGSEFSPWRGPFNFNSECEPIEVFSENFDSVTDNELPNCWTALMINASPQANIGINGLSYSAPNAIQLANDNSPTAADILLISPKLSTVATASHRLKFFTRGYGNVSVEVGTINTTTSVAEFNSIETINATANYAEHIVDFTGYEGTDTYIAFRHANTNTSNPVFIDDVRWEPAPSCPDVQGIQAIGLTQNSAAIGWTEGNVATQWEVVYSETANDPSLLTPISSIPGEPQVTIPGLQPDTVYKAWVRSICGEEIGAWSNSITFRTSCEAIATLNENFESTAWGTLPECWSAILAEGSVLNSSVRVQTNEAASGMNAVALFNGDPGNNSKIILVAPHLNTVATGTHRIKFYARANAPASLQVGTLTSPASGATFTSMQSIDMTSTYTEYVVDFSNYSGTDSYIGIRHTGALYTTLYIDDVRWELTPSCADVTNVQVGNITPTTASVNWQTNAGETNWDLVYTSEDITDPNTLTPIIPSPTANAGTVLSGLTDDTVYKVWVRSVCAGANGNGAWIGPIIFRTLCFPKETLNEGFETTAYGELPNCWRSILAGPTLGQYAAVRTVTNDAAFGTNAVEIHVNSSEPTDLIMLVSPYLSTLPSGTHRLKFYALSYNQDTPLQIGTLNGTTSDASYTLFQPITLGTGYNEYVIDFTTYSGTDNYIAFRNVTGNYNSTFIDNVRWEILPACSDVTNIVPSTIEAETATISWTAGGNETKWQVAYGPTNVTDPETLAPSEIVTTTDFQITGLQDNTFFNVWVRSVCDGPDGNGAWIGPITFKTLCLPTSLPYTQDFQSANIPNLPDCSITERIGQGNNWQTTWGDSAYGFEGTVLSYSGNGSDATAWYFTQGVELTAGVEYTISYVYGNNSSDNFVESLQVLYGPEPNSGSMTAEIADHAEINTGTATLNETTFIPTTTGAYYFGFLAYSAANQGQLYLDNITVSAPLATPGNDWNTLSFYPNPVKDALHISNEKDITSVTIFNLLGQKVQEATINANTTKVDMSHLASGAYMVKIMANDQIKTIKIIKE